MASRLTEQSKVNVSADNMTATLFLEPPSDGIAYSVDELLTFVKNKGIYGGVIYSALEEMSQENIYYKDHVIAKGSYPEEGSDGYYEVFFDDVKKRKPAIRSDGSVDYQSMSEIQNVSVGDKLIQYHKAVQGKQGVDVRGRSLRSKPCKDLPAIKGTGFSFDEDTGMYTAATEGRIEFDGKTLRISNVYEFKGDLGLVVGKIDFRGDVVIKGNVLSGTYIRATRTITVEGSVEAATLIAGGDIILKKGMQGGQKARIVSGGNVYANFIEFTQVEAKDNVEANIIMNCNIKAGKDIVISGHRGAIVGGFSYAVGMINSTILGNIAGLKTTASVGITKNMLIREKILSTKLEATKKSIETAKKEIIKLSDSRIGNEKKEVRAAKISQLNRRVQRDEKIVAHMSQEMGEIAEIKGIGSRAKISIAGTTYIGSHIVVDDLSMDIERDYKRVDFIKNKQEDRIEIIQN